jgi:hypothetical protein
MSLMPLVKSGLIEDIREMLPGRQVCRELEDEKPCGLFLL